MSQRDGKSAARHDCPTSSGAVRKDDASSNPRCLVRATMPCPIRDALSEPRRVSERWVSLHVQASARLRFTARMEFSDRAKSRLTKQRITCAVLRMFAAPRSIITALSREDRTGVTDSGSDNAAAHGNRQRKRQAAKRRHHGLPCRRVAD